MGGIGVADETIQKVWVIAVLLGLLIFPGSKTRENYWRSLVLSCKSCQCISLFSFYKSQITEDLLQLGFCVAWRDVVIMGFQAHFISLADQVVCQRRGLNDSIFKDGRGDGRVCLRIYNVQKNRVASVPVS